MTLVLAGAMGFASGARAQGGATPRGGGGAAGGPPSAGAAPSRPGDALGGHGETLGEKWPVEEGTTDLVPPVLISDAVVPYPDGANGDATVVLMLTIGRDGAVQAVRATEGAEPFAIAAEEAARAWQFEPARRRGQAVAARIRFEVTFHPPTLDTHAAASAGDVRSPSTGADGARGDGGAGASSTARSPAVEGRPVEITVIGQKNPPGVSTLARAEVRQLPGAFGDPFRAIEALPGVTPIVSGIPFFYLRGAPPGNIGYFLDGIRVPYLYHVGVGPSVIHPGLVDRVDLYAGGYPAQFGRFSGGIVAAEAVSPRADFHGEGNARVFDVGVLSETGFADGRGTALLGGRYSFTAAMLSLLAPDVRLDYRDFQARVSYDVTPNDRVTMFGFGAYDLVGETRRGRLNVLFGSEFYRLDTRFDHRFGQDSNLRAAVTLGLDRTKIPDQPRVAFESQVRARLEAVHATSSHVVLRGGGDVAFEAYRADERPYVDPDDPSTNDFNGLFPPRDDVTLGAWVDAVMKYPGVTFTPGLRVDLFRSGSVNAVGVDPRLASRLDVTDRIHVLHAIGIAHQPPSFIIPIPGLAIGSLQGGLQTSLQTSAGVEVDLPEATTATLTGFDNVFLNMSDTLGTVRNGNDDEGEFVNRRSLGSAIGVEFSLRRKLTRRLGGFLSYTLSRSTRSVGRETFPSTFDRTHVANAALSFDLGRNWRAGTRLVFYTGAPPQAGSSGATRPGERALSTERDPMFFRVDLRAEKRWNFSPRFWLSFVIEVMNASLSKETLFATEIGPVTIPSIGVELGF